MFKLFLGMDVFCKDEWIEAKVSSSQAQVRSKMKDLFSSSIPGVLEGIFRIMDSSNTVLYLVN
jgi:hypothetical protein